jgi:hypothetical protein
MTTTEATPDPQAIKARQQQTWASGDYAAVGARILLVAEQLCDAADLLAGSRVVDVATGSSNAAPRGGPLRLRGDRDRLRAVPARLGTGAGGLRKGSG